MKNNFASCGLRIDTRNVDGVRQAVVEDGADANANVFEFNFFPDGLWDTEAAAAATATTSPAQAQLGLKSYRGDATGVRHAVVDGADASRLAESALALLALLRDAWLLRTRPLLVLVSKAELDGALDADAVAAGLGLPALAAQGLVRGTPKVLQVSAVDGRNLADGFRWCCEGGVEVERT